MSARPIGSATVSFGLVSVPVTLYASSESQAKISFNWLDKKTGSRLKQQYISAQSGEKVEKEDMIKGYEFSKGQYVTFTPEELKALEQKATNSIEITEFVPADQVERMYLDRAYHLGPDKGGERAYRLLARAMRETGLSAIGKYAARGKQYLVLVRPTENGLVMEQLHYPDEIRPFSEIPVPEGEVKDDELKLAVQLIQQAASREFRPEKYKDEVRERVLELIQRKVEGEEITAAPTEEPKTQIIDLMEALKASLAKGARPGATVRKPTKRAGSRRATSKATKKSKKDAKEHD